jgi:hypothetical protein
VRLWTNLSPGFLVPCVRSKLNQVEAKVIYYNKHIYILSRMSMRIMHVDYGDYGMRHKDGESKD